MLLEQKAALRHIAWAAHPALQTVTGRIVMPNIFISSENNKSSKWVKCPAAADLAHTGSRYNLTLRNTAQCTGAASGRAAHHSTAQRAARTHVLVQQDAIPCTVLRCGLRVLTPRSIAYVLPRCYITSPHLYVPEPIHTRLKSHTTGQLHFPPIPHAMAWDGT